MSSRIALVTGANRGIGLEIVRQLAAAGDTVILGARDLAKGQAAAAHLRAAAAQPQRTAPDSQAAATESQAASHSSATPAQSQAAAAQSQAAGPSSQGAAAPIQGAAAQSPPASADAGGAAPPLDGAPTHPQSAPPRLQGGAAHPKGAAHLRSDAAHAEGAAVRPQGDAGPLDAGAAHLQGAPTQLQGEILPIELDVANPTHAEALARTLESRFGRLDILVNNAAIHYDTWQSAVGADLDVVREAFDTNVLGAWQVTQAVLPLLRRSEHPRIVNVSSEAGSLASMGPWAPAYNVSKVSLNALTVMWAKELRGILVNSICPGWVATDMGGPGGRPVVEGAASVLWAVNLPDDGPTGGFYRDAHPIPW